MGDFDPAVALAFASETDSPRRKRSKCSKEWFLQRSKFGHTELLCELRDNEPKDFQNFLRMDVESYNEILLTFPEMSQPIHRCELTTDKPSITWHVEEDDGDRDFLIHTLFLKGAVLGATAVKGERNIVQVETKDFAGDEVNTPLFSLTLGLNDCCFLDTSFAQQHPATLRLIQGTGPVCISAQHLTEFPPDANINDSQDDLYVTEVNTEDEEDSPLKKANKRKAAQLKAAKSKKGKLDASVEDEDDEDESMEEDEEEVDEDEDDDDEDEDEDEEEEEESPPKKGAKGKAKKNVKGDKGSANGSKAKKPVKAPNGKAAGKKGKKAKA